MTRRRVLDSFQLRQDHAFGVEMLVEPHALKCPPVELLVQRGHLGLHIREALGQALVPRIELKTARMAQFLDQQINLLARSAQQNTDDLYARIQTEFQSDISGGLPPSIGQKPDPKVEVSTQLRGL